MVNKSQAKILCLGIPLTAYRYSVLFGMWLPLCLCCLAYLRIAVSAAHWLTLNNPIGMFCVICMGVTRGRSRIPHRRGCQPSRRGSKPMILLQFSQKLHEIEKIVGCRGHMPVVPPRSTTSYCLLAVNLYL